MVANTPMLVISNEDIALHINSQSWLFFFTFHITFIDLLQSVIQPLLSTDVQKSPLRVTVIENGRSALWHAAILWGILYFFRNFRFETWTLTHTLLKCLVQTAHSPVLSSSLRFLLYFSSGFAVLERARAHLCTELTYGRPKKQFSRRIISWVRIPPLLLPRPLESTFERYNNLNMAIVPARLTPTF